MEWHSFAAIREPGMPGFSMVVSRAGDWTSAIIANPPEKLWVRSVPTLGVMRIVPMFRRLLVVATGSGIGPCAPHIFDQKTAIKVLWTAPNVRETFGHKLVDQILAASPDAVIYGRQKINDVNRPLGLNFPLFPDTRKHGKPDMVKLVHRLVREFDAEAVAIISNQTLTYKVVYEMTSRGIPAFGAIWDS
jgi:hypothetical protein